MGCTRDLERGGMQQRGGHFLPRDGYDRSTSQVVYCIGLWLTRVPYPRRYSPVRFRLVVVHLPGSGWL